MPAYEGIERRLCFLIAGENDEPAGLRVEPVDGIRPAESSIQARFEVILSPIRRGDGHPGGLVYDQHALVGIGALQPRGHELQLVNIIIPKGVFGQSGEGHALVGDGVLYGKAIGEEPYRLTGERVYVIPLVSPKGEARVRKLHPYLMVPPCVQIYIEERNVLARLDPHEIEGGGLGALRPLGYDAGAVGIKIAEYVILEPALFGRRAHYERRIALLRARPVLFRKLGHEARGGLARPRKDHNAAHRPVQPVDEAAVNLAGLRVLFLYISLDRRQKIGIARIIRL